MRVLFLGAGTSTGVPIIGCKCRVCASSNPRNKRLRASVLVAIDNKNILIDTATDLRQQALRHDITRVDAVLYTHGHADHLHGIDELRSFNFLQWSSIPVYGNKKTIERIRGSFAYIFDGANEGGGKPKITLNEIDGPFTAAGVEVEPLPAWHGKQSIYGYLIGQFAYLTDVSALPEDTVERVTGKEVVVLDALRFEEHPTHMNIAQALETAAAIGAKRTFFIHMGHSVDHDKVSADLPEGVELAYDGLEIIIQERGAAPQQN